MDDIRIKDLTSAAGQLDEFDKFEFIVDVPSAEASMKVSGKEIKGIMAPKQHIHALSDVSGLTGELEKKLDKKGGAITGDLSVMGEPICDDCIWKNFSRFLNIVTTGSRRSSATSGRLRDAALSQRLSGRSVR